MSTSHLLVVILIAAPTAVRANEDCADATLLASGVAVLDATLGLEEVQADTSCGVDDGFARWFRFTAPTEDRYMFTTSGSALDTTVAVFNECDGAELACNDDTMESLQAEAFVHLVEAQSVVVRVAGWGGTRGELVVRADSAAALARPANDQCEDAAPVTLGRGAAVDTLNASGADLSSCGPDDAVDLWYSFVAPAAGRYELSLTQQLIAAHFVSVHEGCGGAELACGFQGTDVDLAEGQAITIRVGSNPAIAESFNLNVGPKPFAPVPANDTHLGAIPVTAPSTTLGTTRSAEREGMSWGPVCGAYVNAAVWYSFTAANDGVYVFDTDGSAMADTVLAIFEACDSNGEALPRMLGCDDDFGTARHSRLEGFIERGTTVCLAVAGHHLSEEGDFRLNVTTPLAPPLNGECAKATAIEVGPPTYGQNFSAIPLAAVGTCPYGEFALWYRFTAPADGAYKFDVKASRESSPDIAVYADCEASEPLACETDPMPAVHVDMVAGQTVRVRVATDVWWRSVMAVRVGPVRPIEEPEPDEDPVVELVEVIELAPESEPEPVNEPEPMTEPEPVSELAPEIVEPEVTVTRAVEGGCGCQGGDASALTLLVLALLALRRAAVHTATLRSRR